MALTLPRGAARHVRALRNHAALFERYRGFHRCMGRLDRRLADGGMEAAGVPWATVSELYAHWGDPPDQADEIYLRSCLAEAARATGPIVQCGASLQTVVLGLVCSAAADPARQLWCLEHDGHWANVVRSWLTQYQVTASHVIVSRARLFADYAWFAVDTSRLAGGISLLLCEGARATPRGIVGALARLGDRLAEDCTVLARGITGADDLAALNGWAQANGAACVVVDRRQGFVKITRRPPSAD